MEYPKRKPNRLTNYDYSHPGAYFITVCTKDKEQILWKPKSMLPVGEAISLPQYTVNLSKYGKIVHTAIKNIPQHYPGVHVDRFVVMPNHFHLLLMISRGSGRIISAPTVSNIVGQMKRIVSKQIGKSIWQKSYHDHIIRNEADYLRIWQYIDTNPATWERDCFYTEE